MTGIIVIKAADCFCNTTERAFFINENTEELRVACRKQMWAELTDERKAELGLSGGMFVASEEWFPSES